MTETMTWILILVLKMGHVTVIDNISTAQECNILANKIKIVYEKEITKAECFSVKKSK